MCEPCQLSDCESELLIALHVVVIVTVYSLVQQYNCGLSSHGEGEAGAGIIH